MGIMFKDSKQERDLLSRFVCALETLADRSRDDLIFKCDLLAMEIKIMTAIQNFEVKMTSFLGKIGTAFDGVASDVQFLKDKIAELQNNPGPISAEDQAILDAMETKATALTAKVEALDASTNNPPTP